MNRRQAKLEAINNKRTWGELREIVNRANRNGMSRVNKSLTKIQVYEIFKKIIDARDLSEIPTGERYSVSRNRYVMTGDGLAIFNLLREFA